MPIKYHQDYNKTPRQRYMQHARSARARGIAFKLTYKQWWSIWTLSGKWHLRGVRGDQYCMARKGDRGAYEVGNVSIITAAQNYRERQKRPKPLPGTLVFQIRP